MPLARGDDQLQLASVGADGRFFLFREAIMGNWGGADRADGGSTASRTGRWERQQFPD